MYSGIEIGPAPVPAAEVQRDRLIYRLAEAHRGTYRYVIVLGN